MNRKRTIGTLALLTTGIAAFTASPASATSIIGFGNSAHDNACTNHGGALANGPTTQQSGSAAGLALALPGSGPVNQCGNLGLPIELLDARSMTEAKALLPARRPTSAL